MNEKTFPYVKIEKMNEMLQKLSPKSLEDIGLLVTDISKIFETSKSNTYNLLTTLKALKLIEGEIEYKFTKLGKEYCLSLLRNNFNKAKEIIRKIIDKFDYFNDIKLKLKQKGKIETKEIGNIVALNYNQNWSSPITLKTYGAAIASILSFVDIGFYRSGYLSVKRVEALKENISNPIAYYDKILKILEKIFPNGREQEEIIDAFDTGKTKIASELPNIIELGFAERPYRGFYQLTKIGKNMLSPYLDEKEKKRIFCKALLLSRYGLIIKEIRRLETISTEDMREALSFEFANFGSEWNAETTVVTHTKVFLNWLVNADILERTERGNYSWNPLIDIEVDAELKTQSPISTEEKKSKLEITHHNFYLLGKNIGLLYDENLNFEESDAIIQNVITICTQEVILNPILNNLQNDYKLFLDLKDSRVFERNIHQIEKILGVKNNVSRK